MSKKEKDKVKEEEVKKPEAAESEAAEGEAAPKKSKKKLILIIAVAVLVLGGGAAGVIFSGVLGGKKDAAGKKTEEVKLDKDGKAIKLNKDGKPMTAEEIAAEKSVFFAMPDLIVNLNSPTPRPHFVNLKISLEVKNRATVKEVEEQLPRITDSFNTYLRELRREDLDGSAGMYRLQKEMMLRLDKILGPGVVKDVLFTGIVVQ